MKGLPDCECDTMNELPAKRWQAFTLSALPNYRPKPRRRQARAAFTLIELLARQPKPWRRQARAAFTLIELLVVVAIIGILAGLISSAAHCAREEARRTKCLSNIRQMLLATTAYAADHGGRYPPAYARDFGSGKTTSWESYLWEMGTEYRIHQCPSFQGKAMWRNDRYTGYNYNASYIGGRTLKAGAERKPGSTHSATVASVMDPHSCALFGDGEYRSGANKFMRSPYPGPLDNDGGLAASGTQGFRHRGRTNVGFADGHAKSLKTRYTNTAGGGKPAEGCGFLSPDNSLYDLE
jgi:prepilin-type N-terminal cleavage/methylation domain-containing protein/prepilin-type processing-associated H-X9-DG protein